MKEIYLRREEYSGQKKKNTKAGRKKQHGCRNQRDCSDYKGDVCGDAMT